MSKPNVPLTMTVTPEQREALDARADAEGISRSAMARKLLTDALGVPASLRARDERREERADA